MLSADRDGDPNMVYLAITNILTRWGLRQNVETLFKGALMQQSNISPAPPNVHAKRVAGFAGHIFVSKRTEWAENTFEEAWHSHQSMQEEQQIMKSTQARAL